LMLTMPFVEVDGSGRPSSLNKLSRRRSRHSSSWCAGRSPPHIRTVTELYKLLKDAGFALRGDLEDQLYILNKYYTVTRYPDAANGLPSEAVDKIEAERAYGLAAEVVKTIEDYLARSLGSG